MTVAAFLISCLALLVSGLTYRRGGARVEVKAELQDLVSPGQREDVVVVRVVNQGLAAAQVTGLFFEFGGERAAVPLEPMGAPIPAVVPGQHSEQWVVPLAWLLTNDHPGGRLRAGVVLGNGKTVRTEWVLRVEGGREL